MGDVRFAAREGSQTTLVLMQQCCGIEDGRGKKETNNLEKEWNYRLLMDNIMETGQVSPIDMRTFDDYGLEEFILNFEREVFNIFRKLNLHSHLC